MSILKENLYTQLALNFGRLSAATYGVAIQELKAEGKLPSDAEHRQVKMS